MDTMVKDKKTTLTMTIIGKETGIWEATRRSGKIDGLKRTITTTTTITEEPIRTTMPIAMDQTQAFKNMGSRRRKRVFGSTSTTIPFIRTTKGVEQNLGIGKRTTTTERVS